MIRMVNPWAAMRFKQFVQFELFAGIQPGGGFIEQQQGRIGGERARDLDQPLMAIGKAGDQLVGPRPQPDKGQRRHRTLRQRITAAGAGQGIARPLGADHHVLQRGHRAEQPDILKRPPQPRGGPQMRRHVGDVGAVEHHLAGGGLVEAGQHVQRRGLAGTVRPDQGMDTAPPDLDIDIVDRFQAAEIFAKPLDVEHDVATDSGRNQFQRRAGGMRFGLAAPALVAALMNPQMPSGMKRMIRITDSP